MLGEKKLKTLQHNIVAKNFCYVFNSEPKNVDKSGTSSCDTEIYTVNTQHINYLAHKKRSETMIKCNQLQGSR